MTPEQLKELAEFAAEFLPWLDNIDEQKLFYDGTYSPILMHLAQEKLEKEGLYYTTNNFHAQGTSWAITNFAKDYGPVYDKNKFIAFWEAVMQAKGGK